MVSSSDCPYFYSGFFLEFWIKEFFSFLSVWAIWRVPSCRFFVPTEIIFFLISRIPVGLLPTFSDIIKNIIIFLCLGLGQDYFLLVLLVWFCNSELFFLIFWFYKKLTLLRSKIRYYIIVSSVLRLNNSGIRRN